MIVECAWCGCVVGEKDGRGVEGITSGICDGCFAGISAEISPGAEMAQPEPIERVVLRG